MSQAIEEVVRSKYGSVAISGLSTEQAAQLLAEYGHHLGMAFQPPRDREPCAVVALHPQRECLNSPRRQPAVERAR